MKTRTPFLHRGFGAEWILVALTLLVFLLSGTRAADEKPGQGERIYQLRIYEIFENNKAAFHERFRDHAARIMKKYDFNIISMWEAETEGRTEFIYMLEWPSEEVMTDRWTKFMADQEWSDIKKKTAAVHGKLVGEIQDRVLRLTDYSPR